MQPPELKNKLYLGDSVYVGFDGYHIWLTTENGLPDDPSNAIALEPHLIDLLVKYHERLKSIYSEEAADATTGA